jgi:hypothetical protein
MSEVTPPSEQRAEQRADEPGYEPEPEAAIGGPVEPPVERPAAEPATDSALAAARERRGIRVRTLVFGVVMLVISIVTLVTLTTAVRVDGAAIGLTLLLGAGAILVAGGAASAVREARGGPGAGR